MSKRLARLTPSQDDKGSNMKVIKTVAGKRDSLLLLLSTEEKKQIAEKAKKWARGNVSAWVRYAATEFEPTEQHLATVEK